LFFLAPRTFPSSEIQRFECFSGSVSRVVQFLCFPGACARTLFTKPVFSWNLHFISEGTFSGFVGVSLRCLFSFIWFYMVSIWFYLVYIAFYMILYGCMWFCIVSYGFLEFVVFGYIWFYNACAWSRYCFIWFCIVFAWFNIVLFGFIWFSFWFTTFLFLFYTAMKSSLYFRKYVCRICWGFVKACFSFISDHIFRS